MAEKEIFVADNLLSACQAWQEVVDSEATIEAKNAAGQEACLALRGLEDYCGTRRLIVKSGAALMLREIYHDDDPWAAIHFRQVVARGWLGKVSYIALNGDGSIAWPLYDAKVLNTREVEIKIDDPLPPADEHPLPTDKIRRPLFLPVAQIDYALPSARI